MNRGGFGSTGFFSHARGNRIFKRCEGFTKRQLEGGGVVVSWSLVRRRIQVYRNSGRGRKGCPVNSWRNEVWRLLDSSNRIDGWTISTGDSGRMVSNRLSSCLCHKLSVAPLGIHTYFLSETMPE